MALIKAKPTSPGRRFVVSVKTPGLHKGKPFAGLLEKKGKTGGRNNAGRITSRHIGGGHKQRYRLIDFKRNKDGIDSVVERIEYDPNRSAHIALLKYMDGERRYIIAPKGVAEGARLRSGDDAGIKNGNCLRLRNIPVGSDCSLYRNETRQGCANCAFRWHLGAVCRSRWRLCHFTFALRRNAQSAG